MPVKPDGGRDISLVANPLTGRFDFSFDETNNPGFDDSDSHLVLSLLLEYKSRYWADPTGTRGSNLTRDKSDRASTRNDLEAAVRDALAPAIQDGRLQGLDRVSAVRITTGRYDLTIYYRNGAGHQKTVRLPWE